MKTLNSLTLLCLSAVLFSCKKETAPQSANSGLRPDAGTLATTMPETYSQTSTFPVANTLGYYSGDFNGDGSSDVFQPYNNNGLLGIYVHQIANGGSPTTLVNQTAGLNDAGALSIGFVVGDYDGDGRDDLIQCWNWQGQMALNVLRSTGFSFVNTVENVMSKPATTIGLYPVDVDGDGKTDVAQLLSNGGQLRIIVYRSTGSSFVEYSDDTMAQGSGSVGFFTDNLDSDSKTEIVQGWNNGGNLSYIVYHVVNGHYTQYFTGNTTQGAGNTGLIPIDFAGTSAPAMVQAWNENGRTSFFLYTIVWSPNTGVGLDYSLPQYFTTNQGAGNVAWLSVKRAGQNNSVLQVWNNGGFVAFFKYTPTL
ncbi:FG-GAP-like repeat-containing protein [Chitinophaga sancti]|uniref:FG-GAP-like repeat-containing protein n=1 Tax=Chitinophaga sancti TaxID=1004 RepID=A0A1K1MNJ6_9BACT|nr:FG-GAP-like repeat-containing protein [Chitinophaga sancti]WQD62757.1 FG-GAP-like repeat-containing protein [Chitinophaga sancti]WQG91619.1 FG-GAP-like repeat-containing protein [Chitinophaga sancti]SFW23494.1 Repeat domain-containing protein [Chitinophaga sancti]